MRGRTVGILVVLGILALAGGWYFGTASVPVEKTAIARGQLMFPGIAPRLRDAAKIEISHQGTQTVIEKRPDGKWGVASMHDYPVQPTKLRGLLVGLTQLRLAEPRTSNPAEFSRLGVDDPKNPGSSADLLRVVDKAGKPILSMIVGHRRVRSRGDVPDEVYVRRPDSNQSWLAEGSLVIDADPAQWLNRDIMNIAGDRVASVVVNDGALTFGLLDGRFALTQPKDHPKLEDYKVDDVSRGLNTLTFEAVKPDADFHGTETGHAVFTTKDGLAVTVHVFHAGKDVWARFSNTAISSEAKASADTLNARLAGWSYQLESWKEQSLVPTLDDLKEEAPTKPEPDAAK